MSRVTAGAVTQASLAMDARLATPEVSVVIVTWNSGSQLLECVGSLLASAPSVSCEIIVVDNGSTDGSIARLRAEYPGLHVIANRRNRGLAAANNQGIVASRAPFVLISNPDVLYPPGAVDTLLDLMRRRPRAAFAIARHVYADGRLQTSAGDLPTHAEALLGRRMSWRRRSDGGVWWHRWAHDEEREVGHGAEACYLVRRDAVAEFGAQDERFVLDWEGLDWSARAREAGWQIWFCPAATITHLGSVSLRQVTTRWVLSTHRGMYLYLRPRTSPALRPLLAGVIAARALLKLAATGLGLQFHEALRRGARA